MRGCGYYLWVKKEKTPKNNKRPPGVDGGQSFVVRGGDYFDEAESGISGALSDDAGISNGTIEDIETS